MWGQVKQCGKKNAEWCSDVVKNVMEKKKIVRLRKKDVWKFIKRKEKN